VPCINTNVSLFLDAGKKNNPINTHQAIQFTDPGAAYLTINPEVSVLPVMQSAYWTVDNTAFLWGGFSYYCSSANLQGGTDTKTAIKFATNVLALRLTNFPSP
jgi:hypothetical protein